MSAVRKEINTYDEEYHKVLSIKKRKLIPEWNTLRKTEPISNIVNKFPKKTEIEYNVGFEFLEFFDFCGWYKGKVIDVVDDSKRIYMYDDNTEETVTVEYIDEKLEAPKLGEIGYRFCKKFPRNQGIYNGTIKSISNNLYHCVYDDGEKVSYNHNQFQKLHDMKHGNVIINDRCDKTEIGVSDDSENDDDSTFYIQKEKGVKNRNYHEDMEVN